jgi:hypothetical protein
MADPVGQPVIDGLVTRAAWRADSAGDAMIHRPPPLDGLRLEFMPMPSPYDSARTCRRILQNDPRSPGSKRFGEPLLQPRIRPPCVRNHRGATASPDR